MNEYKILISNIGYCKDLNGSFLQYLLRSYRYINCRRSIQKKLLSKLLGIINKNNIDLCLIAEIDKGSLDNYFFNQFNYLSNSSSFFSHIQNKYGQESIFRKFFFTKGKSNCFLSKKTVKFEEIFLKNGFKKLIYKINLNDISIYFVHLSLSRKIRTKQLSEISNIIDKDDLNIICGDFNIFSGFEELNQLLSKNDLQIVNNNNGFTFPSCNPRKALDLFICSKKIANSVNLNLLEVSISDHLPALLTINKN